MKLVIKNVNIVTIDKIIYGSCVIDNGIITEISCLDNFGDIVIDGNGQYLLPGFIDLHCHGGKNLDFMDASVSEMKSIADFHLQHGTTTMFATTLAGSEEETIQSLDTFSQYLSSNPDGTIVGVHLEGPWLNPLQCGAQDVDYMRVPNSKELIALKSKYPFIMRVSVAPELDNGIDFGKTGEKLGILMSIAHTDADFNTVLKAFNNGYKMLTHFYSGMKGVTRINSYRIAGAVEAGYYLDDMFVELIADGKHLPLELLNLIYKLKGADRICLITDAVRACGLPDGSISIIGSKKNGKSIIIEDGVAKLPDRQSFAGSVATFDRLFKTMASVIGNDFISLSKMCSATPAKIIGLNDRGEISIGKRADLLIIDENLDIVKIIKKGEII